MNLTLLVRCLVPLALAATLSACYVVPIDPRTGQPVPMVTEGASVPAPGAMAPAPRTMQGRLYPLNDAANAAGLVVAQISDTLAGRGSITLAYRGAMLQGEATQVDASYPSFGTVHNAVLGSAQRSFAGRRGVANAYGANGISARCEYVMSGPGLGTGACLFSDGAKYQLHFGG